MKTLLGVIVQNEKIFEKVKSLNFNGALTIDVRRNLKPFTSVIAEFTELRNEKVLQYVEPDAEGRVQLKPNDPHYGDISKFILELTNKEIEIDVKPISINELVKGGSISNDDLDFLCTIGFAVDPDNSEVSKFLEKKIEVVEDAQQSPAQTANVVDFPPAESLPTATV